MALTHICFCKVGVRANNSDVPAIDGESMVSAGLTPSASNQQSSASPADGRGPFARVATDTAIYVAVGANPDATTTTARAYLPANSVEFFQIEPGNKVAVVTA